MQSFRIDVGDLPEKRPPRSYKFVEVASRNARSIVSSAALFGPADPSERRPEEVSESERERESFNRVSVAPSPHLAFHLRQEDSEVAKKGLYALPNVPYKCQGTPDVDLTSMSPKEARTHVMHMRKQLQQEQEEAAAAARQNVAKRRDKALRAAAVGRGGRYMYQQSRLFVRTIPRSHTCHSYSLTHPQVAKAVPASQSCSQGAP